MASEPKYEIDKKGASMDYAEHESTYGLFLDIVKWGVIANVVLMIALAVGFFMGGGLVGGILTFIVLTLASWLLFG